MVEGWIKKWRKETESAIWDKPPLYYKVWNWILMNVDYTTGKLTRSSPQIAEAVQWDENNAVVIPHRETISRIIRWLSDEKMLVSKISGSSCRKYFDITVCNWETYQRENGGLVSQESESLSQRTGSFKEKNKEDKEVPPKPPAEKPVQLPPANGEVIKQADILIDEFNKTFPSSWPVGEKSQASVRALDQASLIRLLTEEKKTLDDLRGYLRWFEKNPKQLIYYHRPSYWHKNYTRFDTIEAAPERVTLSVEETNRRVGI